MSGRRSQPKFKPTDYEPATWRLLHTGHQRGPENMAIDEAILEADQKSQQRFGGHGAAMAQCYNHMIMPLATARDRATVSAMVAKLERLAPDRIG